MMTIHEKIESETAAEAPRELAETHFRAALGVLEAVGAEAASGWTPRRQAQFLSAIADGATVQDAAAEAGLSRRSAYALRRRADGRAFDLGWQAAEILARDALRETLWDRAQNGQSWTTVRDDGERVITTTRHRFDNRLALAMLTRLETRVAERPRDDDVRIAGKMDDLLALIEGGEAPAERAEIIARLFAPPPVIGTCEPCESDLAEESDDLVVWWDGEGESWLTTLPAPPDFDGDEFGRYAEGDYLRTLSEEEQEAIAHFIPEECEPPEHPVTLAAEAERAAWFAAARSAAHPRDVIPLPSGGGDGR
jgi:hypothetical protein